MSNQTLNKRCCMLELAAKIVFFRILSACLWVYQFISQPIKKVVVVVMFKKAAVRWRMTTFSVDYFSFWNVWISDTSIFLIREGMFSDMCFLTQKGNFWWPAWLFCCMIQMFTLTFICRELWIFTLWIWVYLYISTSFGFQNLKNLAKMYILLPAYSD